MVKSPALAPKYPSALFIRKNDSLGELTSMAFSFFGGRLDLLHLRDCEGGVFVEDYVLGFCGGTYLEM